MTLGQGQEMTLTFNTHIQVHLIITLSLESIETDRVISETVL